MTMTIIYLIIPPFLLLLHYRFYACIERKLNRQLMENLMVTYLYGITIYKIIPLVTGHLHMISKILSWQLYIIYSQEHPDVRLITAYTATLSILVKMDWIITPIFILTMLECQGIMHPRLLTIPKKFGISYLEEMHQKQFFIINDYIEAALRFAKKLKKNKFVKYFFTFSPWNLDATYIRPLEGSSETRPIQNENVAPRPTELFVQKNYHLIISRILVCLFPGLILSVESETLQLYLARCFLLFGLCFNFFNIRSNYDMKSFEEEEDKIRSIKDGIYQVCKTFMGIPVTQSVSVCFEGVMYASYHSTGPVPRPMIINGRKYVYVIFSNLEDDLITWNGMPNLAQMIKPCKVNISLETSKSRTMYTVQTTLEGEYISIIGLTSSGELGSPVFIHDDKGKYQLVGLAGSWIKNKSAKYEIIKQPSKFALKKLLQPVKFMRALRFKLLPGMDILKGYIIDIETVLNCQMLVIARSSKMCEVLYNLLRESRLRSNVFLMSNEYVRSPPPELNEKILICTYEQTTRMMRANSPLLKNIEKIIHIIVEDQPTEATTFVQNVIQQTYALRTNRVLEKIYEVYTPAETCSSFKRK